MIFIGQVNGRYDSLYDKLERTESDGRIIIQAGNFGLVNISRKKELSLERINRLLGSRSSYLYIVRGNRDNPAFFNGRKRLPFERIVPLEDASIIESEGRKIFCLGGGISKDRALMTENSDYWRDERVQFDKAVAEPPTGIDIVVTHLAPPYIFNSKFEFEQYDPIVQNDACLCRQLENQRDGMRKVQRVLGRQNAIKLWVTAHDDLGITQNSEGIEFVSLAEMEFFTAQL